MNQLLNAAVPVPHPLTVHLTYPRRNGLLARITQMIDQHGCSLQDCRIEPGSDDLTLRRLTVRARNGDHARQIVSALRDIPAVQVHVADPVLQLHIGGKISVQCKMPVPDAEALASVYTPGVARVCSAIARQRDNVWSLTGKGNAVAIVTDGTAVLGLGNIGPEAAMPVMEGKAMLFKQFGEVDAYPLCLQTRSVDAIVNTVANLSVGFGGINLEDIAAPRCFAIETRLQARLDIPVFHDDQHGTAIVVLAGLLNALRLAGKKLSKVRIVISGAGAAGTAVTRMLLQSGAKNLIVCDRLGILHPWRVAPLPPAKQWLASNTNSRSLTGNLERALHNADVFIGVSAPNLLDARAIKRMARHPIVFALSNPVPEISPEQARKHAFIVATGRSDYPNQINNALAFPGVFRGALNVRARRINDQMKLQAAHALAQCVSAAELNPGHIIPSVFDPRVVPRVAAAVEQAALETGVAALAPATAKPSTKRPHLLPIAS